MLSAPCVCVLDCLLAVRVHSYANSLVESWLKHQVQWQVELMEIGTQVFVKGKGRGIVALNNEDGTWFLDCSDAQCVSEWVG